MAAEKSFHIDSVQLDDLLPTTSEVKTTVEDKTILNTPIPISASTFRQPLQENSLNLSDNSSLKVSQLASSTVSNMSADRSLSLRHFMTDENQPQEFYAHEICGSVGSLSTSRASWGLVPEEFMTELSNDELLPSVSSRLASLSASAVRMRTVDLAESCELSESSSSSVVSPKTNTVSEVVHKNQTPGEESAAISSSNAQPQCHKGGCSAGPAGGVMAVLSAMLGSGGKGQGDSEFEDSVYDVVLKESDIRQFDDEFSDLETTADFEEEELCCERDLEFSSSHWNLLEEKFPQLTDQRLEPINEEPNGSQVFDYDLSETADYERQDRLASLYFCPTSSFINNADGEDILAEDRRRTSDTALAFQLNGSADFFHLSFEDKQHLKAEEVEIARQDALQSETLMGDEDAGSQGFQSLFQIVQQHITQNSSGQSNEILQTSDTSENSLIDMTLLRSSDGNGDASNVTMKDGMDGENEDKENSQLSRIQFSEVLHLAGGDGLPTLGKFSDVRKEQRKSSKDEMSFPVSINKPTSSDDNSPVYVNEEGEWVTNLAYSHPLGNPFEDSHEGANFGNFSNYEGIDDAAEVFGNEDEFKSGESCLDMLDMDQKNFEKENVFVQDAVFAPSNTASDTGDSWSFQSHLSNLYDISDQVEEMEPYMRISIGAFIGSRTETLGSLDGITDSRPTFGSKFTTPPSNRKPVPLLDGNASASEVAKGDVVEDTMKSVVTNMFGATTACSDVDYTLTASELISESGSVKPIKRGPSIGNQAPADELNNSISQSLSLSELSSTASSIENHLQFPKIDRSDVAADPSGVKTNSRLSGLTRSLITQSETSFSESGYDASLSKNANRSKPDVTSSAALTNSQLRAASKLPTLLAPTDTKRSSITKTIARADDIKTDLTNTLSDSVNTKHHKASISKLSSNFATGRTSDAESVKHTTAKTLSGSERKLVSLEPLKTGSTKCSLETENTKSFALHYSCKPESVLYDTEELSLGSSGHSTRTGSGVSCLKTGSAPSSNKKSIPISASRTERLQDVKPNSSEASSNRTKHSLSSETWQISAVLEEVPKTGGVSKRLADSNITQSLFMQNAKMAGMHSVMNAAVATPSAENLTVTSGNKVNFDSSCASVPRKTWYSASDTFETSPLNNSPHRLRESSLFCSSLDTVSKSKLASDSVVVKPLTSSSDEVPSTTDHLKSGATLTEIEMDACSNPLLHKVNPEGYASDKREVAKEGRTRVDASEKSLEGSWNNLGETSSYGGSLEQTTVLNITDIARKISMSSESENPEDLAELIAVISNSKWNGKTLQGHDARKEVSSDLSNSKKFEVTKSACVSNFVNNNRDINCRENVVLSETAIAKMSVFCEMSKNKTDAVNTVGISPNRIGPKLCSITSEPLSSKEDTFKLPELSVAQNQKPHVIRGKVKKPRTEENFNFRSPRPSSCFSRSRRQELEQSVLVNSCMAAEVSFSNHPSMANETSQPMDCFRNAAGNVPCPPINSWSSVDISADLGQTVKLKSSVTTIDTGDAKRNSLSKVARSFSFQRAVAAGDIFNRGNDDSPESNVTSGGSAAEAGSRAVAAADEQRKHKSKSAIDKGLSTLPSQCSKTQNSGFLVPQCESFKTIKTSVLTAAGAKSARLSTGLMGDSFFDASRMLPTPVDENISQLSQYPVTKPSVKCTTNVSLMTSALSTSGINDSLAIDPFTQSTPMVKTSAQPYMYEPMYNVPGYQGGMNQMMTKQQIDPVRLDLPSELSFQEVCCVGLLIDDTLRVTNPSPYWVHTHFCLVSLNVDGQNLDPCSVLPFIVKQRLMLQPFGNEDVKISFAPRHPGSFVAQLTLLVDQPRHSSTLPMTITLRAVAEKPCIQIITPVTELHLDFGALPWGSHKVMPLTLVNKGRAMVPVRLFISYPKSSSCCFSFAYYDGDVTNANMNMSAQCSCILRGIDANSKEFPVSLMVVFRAPNQQSAQGIIPVQEALGFIALEIDLPAVVMPLGSVRLRGLSGTARLHAPEQMDMLVLKAEVGTGPQMQIVPLRNAGNIPLDVSLEMAHWTDLFTVTPMQVMIEPGGQSEVCVRFEPTSAAVKGVRFDSLLFMIIEPDGPAYEIPVMGEIVSKVSSRELSKLLSNRSFVAWGGMPVGKTGSQMVTLKNNSNKLLKLLLEIQGSPEFKFLMNYGRKEKMTTSWEIVVKSSEEFPISLAFTPTGVRGSSAKLHIRHAGTSIKYSIPLSGYGGQSQVVLDNIPLRPEGYYLSMASYNGNREAVVMVTLRNTGTRAAFINGQSFQDLTCSVALTPGKVIMEPNEFCLPVDEKQDVAIIIQLSDKDLSCWEKSPTSFVTVLSFYYGDEISRRLYQKSLNRGNRPSQDFLSSTNLLHKIRFDVHYRNEDLFNEGQEICETADDIALFYKNMTKVTLAVSLSGQSAGGSLRPLIGVDSTSSGFTVTAVARQRQMTSPALQALELAADERALPRSDSPPVRDPSHSVVPSVSMRNVSVEERLEVIESSARRGLESVTSDSPWRIEPEELCIEYTAGDQRPEVKHVYVINNKDSTIRFDISWPAHCLSITPEHGTVSPKSSLQLSVCTSDRLRDGGIVLPWNGMLHITCEGQVKVVHVQILEAVAICNTTSGVKAVRQAQTGTAAEPMRPGGQQVVVTITYPSVLEGESDHGQMVKQSLHFPTTQVGQAQDLPMNIMNASMHRVNWVVSGFTPPYLKPIANTQRTDEDQYRILYTVYSMYQSMGTLEPGQKTKIGVRFRPRQSGTYSQHYDVKFERLDVHEQLFTCRLELYGNSIKNDLHGASNSTLGLQGISTVTLSKISALSSNSLSSDVSKDSSSGSKSRPSEGWLICRPKAVEFPKSSGLEPLVEKVVLKNASSVEHKIDLVSPVLPFVVNHSQIVIKSRHYLRLPVEFQPTKPGRYHSVLVLKADTGETFLIQLWAECA